MEVRWLAQWADSRMKDVFFCSLWMSRWINWMMEEAAFTNSVVELFRIGQTIDQLYLTIGILFKS